MVYGMFVFIVLVKFGVNGVVSIFLFEEVIEDFMVMVGMYNFLQGREKLLIGNNDVIYYICFKNDNM